MAAHGRIGVVRMGGADAAIEAFRAVTGVTGAAATTGERCMGVGAGATTGEPIETWTPT